MNCLTETNDARAKTVSVSMATNYQLYGEENKEIGGNGGWGVQKI